MKKPNLSQGKRGFANQCNYVKPEGEVFTLPSNTVPDMSLSLRELLNRHLAGGNVKTFQTANIGPNSLVPDNFERMSAIDLAEFKQQTADFIATTRGRMQTARQAREKASYERKLQAAVDARLAASRQHSSE